MKYAAVMGMETELKLVGNDFTNASTSFFIAYLVFEAPNSTFMKTFVDAAIKQLT
jgi:hypothetical protein